MFFHPLSVCIPTFLQYSTKFEVLEPIPENIVAKSKVSNNGIFGRSEKSNWFRVYRVSGSWPFAW
jgi:hypothetical protein